MAVGSNEGKICLCESKEEEQKRWAIVCGLLGVVCSGWISWSDDVVVIPFGRNYHIDGGRSPAVNV